MWAQVVVSSSDLLMMSLVAEVCCEVLSHFWRCCLISGKQGRNRANVYSISHFTLIKPHRCTASKAEALVLFISCLAPWAFSPSTSFSFLYRWHRPLCSSPHMSEPLVLHEQLGSEMRLQSVKVQKQPTLCQVEIHWRDNPCLLHADWNRQKERGGGGETEERGSISHPPDRKRISSIAS